MKESELKLSMLISGGGTTMEAIGRACQEGELKGLVRPVLVISSREGVGGIKRAQDLGIPVEIILRKNYPLGEEGVAAYGEVLLAVLRRYQPDAITLNGFLAQISRAVIEEYEGRIFNQHPGPVPDFGGRGMYGRRVHAAVIIYNRLTKREVPFTEVVAQRVAPEYDHGQVVGLERIPVEAGDTVESLQQKALPIEHRVQIRMLADLAKGVLKEINQKITWASSPAEYLILGAAKEAAKVLYPQG